MACGQLYFFLAWAQRDRRCFLSMPDTSWFSYLGHRFYHTEQNKMSSCSTQVFLQRSWLSLHKGSTGGEGRNRTVLSGGSKLLAWLSLSCETGIFRFLKDIQSKKKDVSDLCSDPKSCNVKGQLQAVACIHATSHKSSNPI